MQASYFLLAVSLVALVVFFYPAWRQKRLLSEPFPAPWRDILQARLPWLARMPEAEREQVLDLTRLFIADKHFHGCRGVVIDDDMRVTIAATASLLLLNRKTEVYPGLKHILVYPSSFVIEREVRNEDGTVSMHGNELQGESWDSGKVILAWDDVEHSVADFRDGYNVVLHEFSHQLDSEDGDTNGAPFLSRADLPEWASVLSREYEALVAATESGEDTLLDPYGASSPAEFFAVATETFFELTEDLADEHPELFAELLKYYRVDPRRWH